MEAKDKAVQLYNKFRNELPVTAANFRAKKLALIAVDEILQSKPTFLNSKNDVVDFFGNTETEIFYRKVKQEIEKL